ncbi:nucleotidyltransferase family protein [Aphanothece sacrum]|uniref:DNA polymerase beta domain-containing protein region n=1 Tax=Aphanothece sacrum FPU1 TaxID=1920663 RepID=A0A401IN35_APHSA|nr:nucleotidyltransferase domain-containing protein [Aphanothece sacrum]GBF82657.1 DNA polymerase beta domain-containing protein region [Aphanothece sacrum FPU1]GBF84551.1 DNA polymerase beta domain-containing protein [Aphanothece sacrum FPU3]
MKIKNIEIPIKTIQDICKRCKIIEFSLFGSVLRDDFNDKSDIDILIDFAPNAHPTLFTLVDIKDELKSIFNRDVDLITREGIKNSRNHFRRSEILSSVVVIYDARQSIPL